MGDARQRGEEHVEARLAHDLGECGVGSERARRAGPPLYVLVFLEVAPLADVRDPLPI